MHTADPDALFNLLIEKGFDPRYVEGDTEITIPCQSCNDNRRRLYIHASSGAFICFRCEEKGGMLELLVDVLGMDLSEAITERSKLRAPRQERFVFKKEAPAVVSHVELPLKFIPFAERDPRSREDWAQRRFASYLERRGIPEKRAIDFGLGYCEEGAYADRIIVPVARGGRLYTFVARSIAVLEPKKVLYPAHSAPSQTLYNYDRLFRGSLDARPVLVEGVFDVLRHFSRCGLAVLGSKLSPKQIQLIRIGAWEGPIVIMFDGDKAGRKGAEGAAEKLAGALIPCKIADLPEGVDPGSATGEQIREALDGARDYLV